MLTRIDDTSCFLYIPEHYDRWREEKHITNSNGFLLVYSITDRKTFEEIIDFYERLKKKDCEHIPMVLVGNKCDLELERVISLDEGKLHAKQLGIPFMETSAKEGLNVNDAFITLVKEALKVKKIQLEEKKKCIIV
ncbi:hypothetical protein FDP41_003473 [Naegleria fowleri]|uniref:Uncharacterized protein n=1 Tax=Naegleria fowleri TaxID=5763 RepID=A0A6A5BSY8_NAEFO|nr:uncharacterized protein FDP41_003473 [Naegleria fowleri]KAF0977481.1 hypothetical protein FDP41_003473 [Naegleria fowleri]CAG4719480.1 unnamed protein product [Naegleria fowleri]